MAGKFRQEIDHRTLKLMVGLVGLSLAFATSFLSGGAIESISAAHCHGGWARDFLVGSLFAIAAFMAAYNGFSRLEKWVAKGAAVAAIGVAWFPSKCGDQAELIPGAHACAAAIMFLMLTAMCWIFYRRARGAPYPGARRRARLYALCGIAIPLSMGIIVVDHFAGGVIEAHVPRLVLYCELVALFAFGVAWLAASHLLPWITAPEERWMRGIAR